MAIIGYVLYRLLGFLEFMVIIECIASWIPGVQNMWFFMMISKFTSVFLNPIRKFMYEKMGNMMIDFSPLILFLIIDVVKRIVINIF
ncbi:MAG: YggT family protein [Clostridia bacterium]|nr:YggT family protein [Clostridia bacterium]